MKTITVFCSQRTTHDLQVPDEVTDVLEIAKLAQAAVNDPTTQWKITEPCASSEICFTDLNSDYIHEVVEDAELNILSVKHIIL
jgi:hypothetical protein